MSHYSRFDILTHLNRQSGFAAFYIVLLLPIVFGLVFTVIDIATWNCARDFLQKEASLIAQQSVSLLPNETQAQDVGNQYLVSLKNLASQFRLKNINGSVESFLGNGIKVTIDGQYQPALYKVLEISSLGQSSKLFEIHRQAIAQLVPVDSVIIFSDGQTMRPGLIQGIAQTPWGNELLWPKAGIFNCSNPTETNLSAPTWDWTQISLWRSPNITRWATQACFNPIFSAVKNAVIAIIDSIGSISTNRISVIESPGSTTLQGFEVLRSIHGKYVSPESNKVFFANSIGGFNSSVPSAYLPSYGDLAGISNNACILFSKPSFDLTNRYTISPPPTESSNDTTFRDPISPRYSNCGQTFVTEDKIRSNLFFPNQLTLRESVYWDEAKLQSPGFDAKPNILAAINAAIKDLSSIAGDEYFAYEVSKRGNLAVSPIRQIVVLTDHLQSSEIASIATTLESLQIQLFLVVFAHDQLPTPTRSNLIDNFNQLKNNPSPNIHLYFAATPDELSFDIIPSILEFTREIAIKSYGE